jgi:hypothetical protein
MTTKECSKRNPSMTSRFTLQNVDRYAAVVEDQMTNEMQKAYAQPAWEAKTPYFNR